MTAEGPPAGAVAIAGETLTRLGYGPDLPYDLDAVLAALDEAGWLYDPKRVAALEAVAAAAREFRIRWEREGSGASFAMHELFRALDAVTATETEGVT